MADDFKVDIDGDVDERVSGMVEVTDTAFEVATKVADIARSTAPVDSGDYAAGIIVQKHRSGARVLAQDPNSAHVEFGVPGRNQPATWNLREAAEAAGLKFKKRGR